MYFLTDPLLTETHQVKRTLLAAALAGLAFAGSASAATLTDSFDFPNSTTEINNTGTLDLFDSSLGTLNSVTLTLFGGGEMTISLTNTAAQDQTTRATGQVDMLWSTSLAGLDLSSVLMGLVFPTGNTTLAPNQTQSFGPLVDVASEILNPAAGLFAGPGTFTITCESLSGIGLVGGGGNIDSTQTTVAGCGAEIVYDYTARTTQVPEPAMLALLGVAAVSASRLARRKSA